MAERLSQKLAKLHPPDPLASRCYGVSRVYTERDVLTVHVSPAEIHTLLWSRFVSSRHIIEVSRERLVLVFLGSQVAVGGLSLAPITEAITMGRLHWLRTLPAGYRDRRGPNETFVDFLAVEDVISIPKPDPAPAEASESDRPAIGPRTEWKQVQPPLTRLASLSAEAIIV